MAGRVEGVNCSTVEVAMPLQPPEAALADLRLHRPEIRDIEVQGRMKYGCAILVGAKHAISDQHMRVGPECTWLLR